MTLTISNPNNQGGLNSTVIVTDKNGISTTSAAGAGATITVTPSLPPIESVQSYNPNTYSVLAVGSTGKQADTAYQFTLNSAPLTVNPTAITGNTAILSWDSGSSGTISAFCVASAPNVIPTTCTRLAGAPFTTVLSQQSIAGLTGNTYYYYQVRNKDGAPSEGWFTTAPQAITATVAKAKACTTTTGCVRTLTLTNNNTNPANTLITISRKIGTNPAVPIVTDVNWTTLTGTAANIRTFADNPTLTTGAPYTTGAVTYIIDVKSNVVGSVGSSTTTINSP
jgi:hypothetical protein